jgi:peptide/nickel transport system substrate-binding protein
VPPADQQRLEADPDLKVLAKPELRVIFLGMDQYRDELLESDVKGRNPFKDVRVRQAFLKAIDVEAIRRAVMRGQSYPTALMVARGVHGRPDDLDVRPGYDPETARKLLADAGYPDGFEVGMDGPNDRYVNDEAICKAVVSMLAKIGVKVNLLAQTRAKYFAKINSLQTSFYMLGWTPVTYDVLNTYQNIMMTRDDAKGSGQYNNGRWSNPEFDDLVAKSAVETDPRKRDEYVREATRIHLDQVGHIPLHQQALVCAMRENVDVAQLADNFFPLRYVVVR